MSYLMMLFKESSAEECMHVLFNDASAILFLIYFIKSYVVVTHLNCLDLSKQFRLVPTTYDFIKKWIKVDRL